MNLRLRQWAVTVNGKTMGMFTPVKCGGEVALAIAVATFGDGITKLIDEGAFNQGVPERLLEIADHTEMCPACKGEAVTSGNCRCEVCDGKGWKMA